MEFLGQKFSQKRLFLIFRIVFNIIPSTFCTFFSQKCFFRTYLFQNTLLPNNVFIMLVLNFFGSSVISTDIQRGMITNLLGQLFICLGIFVISMYSQKLENQCFILYVNFLCKYDSFCFNHSYFHYYLLLWLLLRYDKFSRMSIFDQILFLFYTFTNIN